MNYRKELLKKLFQKLGKSDQKSAASDKSKAIKMTTTISAHDMENKKRQAIGFLKKIAVVKFYIKVNKYDPENIQKGRMMLTNIAEELKSYAKIRVSPVELKEEDTKEEEKGQTLDSIDDFKTATEKRLESDERAKQVIFSDDEVEEEDGLEQIYMELESTVCFGDYDIDSLLETSTLEEFLNNLYKGDILLPGQKKQAEDFSTLSGDSLKPELEFSAEQEEQKAMFDKVQERIKLKKRLRKQSLGEFKVSSHVFHV